MDFEISHYSGCGNDFFIVEDLAERFPHKASRLIAKICKKDPDSLVDGFIVVKPSSLGDFQMLFFNNDGSTAEMCGNGIRCLMRFLKDKCKLTKETAKIEVEGRLFSLKFVGEKIAVDMGKIRLLEPDITLVAQETPWAFDYIHSGVPHLVTFVEDIENLDVNFLGAQFRNHPYFHPEGANVNFVSVKEPNFAVIRTFERGVEGETLACGTGAVAAGFAMKRRSQIDSAITLQVRSNDLLTVNITSDSATMIGPAVWIKDGSLTLSPSSNSFTLKLNPCNAFSCN